MNDLVIREVLETDLLEVVKLQVNSWWETYKGIIDDNCPNCGNEIKVNLYVWEYPVGAINYQEEECEGANIIQGPEYDPFSYDDFW